MSAHIYQNFNTSTSSLKGIPDGKTFYCGTQSCSFTQGNLVAVMFPLHLLELLQNYKQRQ